MKIHRVIHIETRTRRWQFSHYYCVWDLDLSAIQILIYSEYLSPSLKSTFSQTFYKSLFSWILAVDLPFSSPRGELLPITEHRGCTTSTWPCRTLPLPLESGASVSLSNGSLFSPDSLQPWYPDSNLFQILGNFGSLLNMKNIFPVFMDLSKTWCFQDCQLITNTQLERCRSLIIIVQT